LSDLKFISRHAATVLVGQCAAMAFSVTDTIVAARYSDASVAALSVGAAIYMSVFVALMGVLQAMLPLWAELNGARRFQDVGKSFRQALYLCAITILLGLCILLFPDLILQWTDIPSALRVEVRSYLAVLALALPPALLFRMYSTLNQSLGRPQLVTWLQMGSLFVKIPLSIWFVLGGAGLQPQAAVGCAWATLVVNYALLAVAIVMLRTQTEYRPYAIWQRLEAPDWPQIAVFARLGIPGALAILVEVTSFTLMALFIARQGTLASAAHQIAANLTALMFQMPLAISIAASSRVSYWRGAGHTDKALAAIKLGFTLLLAAATVMCAALAVARESVAHIYSANPLVISIAMPLMAWAVAYHFFDALQTLCVFLLRCYRVVVSPLVVYSVLLWGGGLYGGYVLAYQGVGPWAATQSPSAFWAAGAVSLGLTAMIFLGILRVTMQRNPKAEF
jgi:MATE family multidrug resistance protein